MKILHYVLVPNSKVAYELYQKLDGIESTMVPTPREADHCCGIAILYENEEDREKIQKIAEESDIKIDTFFDTESKIDPNRGRFC
ncbi:DUF3343 domain-containing protein [Peptoniphilus sp.]|uniref:DUF3343 domain-containing protein n=1 Tax=Peptoniphilus sp. TaxID=1971214 RepID=UPI00399398B0